MQHDGRAPATLRCTRCRSDVDLVRAVKNHEKSGQLSITSLRSHGMIHDLWLWWCPVVVVVMEVRGLDYLLAGSTRPRGPDRMLEQCRCDWNYVRIRALSRF